MSEIAGARAELTADFLLLFPWELSKRVIVKEHLKAMKSRLAQLAVALFAIALLSCNQSDSNADADELKRRIDQLEEDVAERAAAAKKAKEAAAKGRTPWRPRGRAPAGGRY